MQAKNRDVVFLVFGIGILFVLYSVWSIKNIAHSFNEMIIKRNNPGNIRNYTVNHWQGSNWDQIPEGEFLTFDTLVNGYRAMIKDIHSKIASGFDTIEKIIYRYAPPSENNTEAYIGYVSSTTGINRNKHLLSSDYTTIGTIAFRMSLFEHGVTADGDKKTVMSEAVKESLTLFA